MSPQPDRDAVEALAALQRLHQHGVLSLEEAREAARLITGDEAYEFPPPPRRPEGERPEPKAEGPREDVATPTPS